MINIKSALEISKMRLSGKVVAKALDEAKKYIKPGITTKEIDTICHECILSQGAIPSFLGYNGYPASICASVNSMVIHGIPDNTKLKEGDIISIDVGAILNGYHGDAARTFAVGEISDEAKRLIDVTKESFFKGIEYAKNGERLFSISSAIQDHVEKNGFSVVRGYTGHGIGTSMHEEPEVPNYGIKGKGIRLVKGMTIAIEPMVNYGSFETKVLKDGWSVVTKDGSLSCHYENTVLITDTDCELLTVI